MRFGNLGRTEAQVWDDLIIEHTDEAYLPADDGKSKEQTPGRINERLKGLGLDEATCADALNPGKRFPREAGEDTEHPSAKCLTARSHSESKLCTSSTSSFGDLSYVRRV